MSKQQAEGEEPAIPARSATTSHRPGEFEALMAALPVGVFIAHDRACANLRCNAAGAAMLRIASDADAQEASDPKRQLPFKVMRGGHEVRAEDLPMQFAARTGQSIAGEELDLVFGDGERKTLFESASPLYSPSGKLRGALGVFVDITERKRAERELQRQKGHLRLLAEAATQLLEVEDPAAMVSGLFERVREHLGCDVYVTFRITDGSRMELVSSAGLPDELLQRFGGGRIREAPCSLAAERRRDVVQTHLQSSEGSDFDFQRRLGWRCCVAHPLLSNDLLIGTLTFASRSRDSLEDDELEFLKALSQYVTVCYERMRLIERLRDQHRRKDEFLVTLAHELRNPLTPIRNGIELLRLGGSDPKVVERVRALMGRQAGHMVRLIDDLLDLSRTTNGKLKLHKAQVRLQSVIQTAVELTAPLIEARNHTLTVDVPEEPIMLHADAERLAQIFSNLLNNSARFTAPGGQITVCARRMDDQVEVQVRDNGMGIDAETLPAIFDMFTQGGGRADNTQGGVGIGLTLARRLAAMHGGFVHAHSDGPGRGSCFTVRLPFTLDSSAESANEPQAGPLPRPGRLRVLVAESNHDALQSLGLMLQIMGNEVRLAPDGPQALELAESFRPQLMLVDIGMPQLDGYETARPLRATEWGRNLKLVALTGRIPEDGRRAAEEAGFDHHLEKPVEPSQLVQILRECVAADARTAGASSGG